MEDAVDVVEDRNVDTNGVDGVVVEVGLGPASPQLVCRQVGGNRGLRLGCQGAPVQGLMLQAVRRMRPALVSPDLSSSPIPPDAFNISI